MGEIPTGLIIFLIAGNFIVVTAITYAIYTRRLNKQKEEYEEDLIIYWMVAVGETIWREKNGYHQIVKRGDSEWQIQFREKDPVSGERDFSKWYDGQILTKKSDVQLYANNRTSQD